MLLVHSREGMVPGTARMALPAASAPGGFDGDRPVAPHPPIPTPVTTATSKRAVFLIGQYCFQSEMSTSKGS